MKTLFSLALGVCLLAQPVLAQTTSTPQEGINASIDNLVKTIQTIQIQIHQSFEKDGQVDKAMVCTGVDLVGISVSNIKNLVTMDDMKSDTLASNRAQQLGKDADLAQTFCVPANGNRDEVRIYTYAELITKLHQIGNLALLMKK